jgi:hypothetical protein
MNSTTNDTVERVLQFHFPDQKTADFLQQTQLLFGAREALFEFMYSGHDLYYPTRSKS